MGLKVFGQIPTNCSELSCTGTSVSTCRITCTATGLTVPPTPTPVGDNTPMPELIPIAPGDTGSARIVPENLDVIKPSEFTLEIHANTWNQLPGSYHFTLTYDRSLITINPAIGLNGVDPGPEGFVSAVKGDPQVE